MVETTEGKNLILLAVYPSDTPFRMGGPGWEGQNIWKQLRKVEWLQLEHSVQTSTAGILTKLLDGVAKVEDAGERKET